MSDIKNVVFDMGRVLMDYDSSLATRHFTSDTDIIREVDLIVYHSGEWTLLDAGLISEDEAIAAFRKRASSENVADIAVKSFLCWDQYNLTPHPGMDQAVRDLKAAGYHLYILSNISMRFVNNWQLIQQLPASGCYDGMFFSAPHKYIKPQPAIYRLFCEENNLEPSDCIFIDDLERNVDAAIRFGMDGYVFDGDVGKLRKLLLTHQ